MIHPVDPKTSDGPAYQGRRHYVISSHHRWLPGCYDSERAARYAFRFPDAVLRRLSEEICNVHRQNRPITMDDLRAAKETAAA